MKAVYFHQHGGLDVLEYGELPTPTPAAGQVLVRLKAAALNRVDLWVRNGWHGLKLALPHIPGADGAGWIEAVGEEVTMVEAGMPVVINPNIGCGKCMECLAGQDNRCRDWHLLGETISGTYAEYVVVSERNVLPLPPSFPMAEAAAAALVFQTAWHSLITRGQLKAGETVLIVGASGGVNTASIQIAKLAGAIVFVICSNLEKLELAKSLGADFVIDRSQEENWSKVIYHLTDRQGVDVVVDNVGTTFPMSFRAARKGGRILTVGNTGGPVFEIDNRFIFGKHLTIIGSTMSNLMDFHKVMNLIFAGKLRAVIDKIYPLEAARSAQERLEKGRQNGKIVLEIRDS